MASASIDATRGALDEADLVVVSCFPFDDAAQYAELVDAIDATGTTASSSTATRARACSPIATRSSSNFEDFASRSLLVKVGDEDADLLLGDSLDAFVERLRVRRDPRGRRSSPPRVATVPRCTAPAIVRSTPTSCRCPAGRRHDGRR